MTEKVHTSPENLGQAWRYKHDYEVFVKSSQKL